jgi:hypothetical protein
MCIAALLRKRDQGTNESGEMRFRLRVDEFHFAEPRRRGTKHPRADDPMSPAGQAALNRRNDQRTQKRTGLATPSTKSCQRPHICTMSAASHSFGTEFTTGHRGLLSCLVRLRVFAHICLHVLRAPPVRSFYCCVTGAGLAVGAGTGAAETAERPLTETEVRVKTPDGNCDAAFIHPTTGSFPGVLVWPDAASTWTPLAEQLAQHLRGARFPIAPMRRRRRFSVPLGR